MKQAFHRFLVLTDLKSSLLPQAVRLDVGKQLGILDPTPFELSQYRLMSISKLWRRSRRLRILLHSLRLRSNWHLSCQSLGNRCVNHCLHLIHRHFQSPWLVVWKGSASYLFSPFVRTQGEKSKKLELSGFGWSKSSRAVTPGRAS